MISEILVPKTKDEIKNILSKSSKRQLEMALCFACLSGDFDKTKLLLEYDVNINNINISFYLSEGITPLMYAAANSYEEIVLLLQKGADVTTRDNYGCSAFIYAKDNENIKRMLRYYRNKNVKTIIKHIFRTIIMPFNFLKNIKIK